MRKLITQLKKRSQQGFTLVELMAVLAILAILLAIAIPAIGKVIDKSDASADESSIELIERAGEKAHVEKTPFDEPSGDMPEESYTIPTLIEEGYLDLDEDSKFNAPEHYVVKENNQNDRNPNNDDDTTTPNKSGNFVYVGVGAPGNPGSGGDDGTVVIPEDTYTPVTVAPDGCTAVTTVQELKDIKLDMTECYILMNALDLGDVEWVSLIGTSGQVFTGSFNGQRYPITGLKTSNSATSFVGLFSKATGATFEHVNLVDVDIKGNGKVGTLLGSASTVTISDAVASGTVVATGYNAGGLLGEGLLTTQIDKSNTSVNVTAGGTAGGILGWGKVASITNSYATGSIVSSGESGGLVSYMDEGTIENSYATGSVHSLNGSYTGGLVGYVDTTTITGSHATGDVTVAPTAYGSSIGGLIGSVNYLTISDSYATGDVDGKGYVGGFLGEMGSTSTFERSYATGNVTNTEASSGSWSFSTGGFIGQFWDTGTIDDSYSTGSVTANLVGVGDSAGGFIGFLDSDLIITNAYSTGVVNATGFTGGLLGYLDNRFGPVVAFNNSFYNSETTGQSDTGKGDPKTTAQMQQQATYTGFDFTNVWEIEGSGYPTLK